MGGVLSGFPFPGFSVELESLFPFDRSAFLVLQFEEAFYLSFPPLDVADSFLVGNC